ncbi:MULTISPECIES: 3-hydroxyacyl-CoA dehydrogenase NAD-binding domain-containing protein [Halomonas]|uniref:3-hydroxybutyryl-CoA dehydrogenase n=1 Tax=Halomonas halophila TaxID=29573 RepID=A0ABQ0U5T3_9GAMM|nr:MULTISPECIES: 3-hydroxyacyl-CoA dehydrogenase NAD-binding domain-containing protein [Halomonas]MDR5890784.1 3-hydroxyacyl-CoA dehydrogenase NAD-binding domain-containing protein [Halomonas salina]WJY08375.1 3-hydroxyacyl-CoA dehydrogenase NAD-binding domain-containing protein [Halomonas halophila]GEK73521.1 3-hydroxybutyryl-CoA dehydrogenase [Halomonas halophila]
MSQSPIGVVGAGTMGQGIAQVLATAGLTVRLFDVAEEALERARAGIDKGLGKLVAKERLSEDARADALARLRGTTELATLADCEVIIEAAPENPELKERLFRDLSALGDDIILASNTSSLSLTRLAGVCECPERVVGMHFFNPVPVLKLVEVIRAEQTGDATVARVEALAEALGKTAVRVGDSPGFAVNRLLVPMINEAAFLVQEGAATPEAVDQAMQLGAAHPMGPLALADLIGLDVCLAIMEVLQEGFGDPKYRPCPLLRRMVDAGYLGRKSGRGFHVYDGA